MNAPAFTPAQLDEIRMRAPLASIVGQVVKLTRSGREFKGLCPFHNEATPSFTVVEEKGFAHCFGCSWHGDVIRFVMEHQGLPFLDAVRILADGAGVQLAAESATPARDLEREPQESDVVESRVVGRYILDHAVPARGTIVEAWLAYRGLDLASANVQAALDNLLFLRRCPVSPWKRDQGPEDAWLVRPAMVARVDRVRGGPGERDIKPIGVHATYLRPDGRGKAVMPLLRNGEERGARKMWGGIAGGAVLLTAIDCANPNGVPLVVGEGIESTISAMDEQPGAVRGAATLSLGNLQGEILRGPRGEWPLWDPSPDPQRMPFTFRQPGSVVVAVDSDMKPQAGPRGEGVKVQERKGTRYVLRPISGLERAEICAALAVKTWRHAGAWPVRAVRPPVGMDFNDVARRRRG